MLSVSILMPMRNAQDYITAALQSVLQDTPSLLEVIVIDDGSSDGSVEAVRQVSDSRIRIVQGPRRGISAAMNAGLAAARGDLVMRCDADDLYPEGRVAMQSVWLQAHPDHVAVCGASSTMDRRGRLVARLVQRPDQGAGDIDEELRSGITRTHLCTCAVRRDAMVRLGGFREYFETGEDIDFALRLGEAGKVGFVAEDAYRYRLHQTSITHTQRRSRREFFEATAREFQRDRLETASDALMRGTPPAPPDGLETTASSAAHQIHGMLVGQAWESLRLGRRGPAVATMWRACLTQPQRPSSWLGMGKIMWRSLTRRQRA